MAPFRHSGPGHVCSLCGHIQPLQWGRCPGMIHCKVAGWHVHRTLPWDGAAMNQTSGGSCGGGTGSALLSLLSAPHFWGWSQAAQDSVSAANRLRRREEKSDLFELKRRGEFIGRSAEIRAMLRQPVPMCRESNQNSTMQCGTRLVPCFRASTSCRATMGSTLRSGDNRLGGPAAGSGGR